MTMFLRFHPLLLGFAAMFAVSACGSGPAVPEQPEEVEVSVRPMPGDTLMLGYGAALAVHDTLLLIQDNNAPGYIMRLCGYPSLRPLCNFVVKGKGPGELTGVGDFIVDGDSLRLYSNNEPKMLVYAWADLVRGELRPARTITYPAEGEANPFVVSISESKLEMPNAFSPNGDGYNDIYKAKDGYQSIVSFEATIFNRWGQKIYSWNNIDGGWDGKFHGSVVKDGVYYVLVKAKGADGKDYTIRRDVNVLTGYSGTNSSSN